MLHIDRKMNLKLKKQRNFASITIYRLSQICIFQFLTVFKFFVFFLSNAAFIPFFFINALLRPFNEKL